MRTHSLHPSRQRGSIILLALLFTGLMATLAASFGNSTTLQRSVSRDAASGLHAEFAAESGLAYAQRQLSLDPEWQGTGPNGVGMSDGTHFTVTRTSGKSGVHILIDGQSTDGLSQLEAELEVNPGGSGTDDKAFVSYGEETELEHCHINGDALLTDEVGMVEDWFNNADGTGYYRLGGPEEIEEIEIEFPDVSGTLYKFTDQTYLGCCGSEQKLLDPVRIPAWNLESWLVPQPGVQIFTDTYEIRNQHFDDVVVLVYTGSGEEEDEEVELRNCQFNAGIVIYTPLDTNLREEGEDELEFEIRNCHVGSAASGSTVGVLAPAHKVEIEECQIYGLVYCGELELENSHVDGQVFAVREGELEHGHVTYNPAVASNPPDGITLDSSSGGVVLKGLHERYDG